MMVYTQCARKVGFTTFDTLLDAARWTVKNGHLIVRARGTDRIVNKYGKVIINHYTKGVK